MVSVVILTANRPRLLRRVLHALSAGTLVPGEVVIVDNGKPGDAHQFADDSSLGFPVKVIDGPAGRYAEARNAGVRHTSHDLVAFFDDDCEPDRRCLERLAAALRDADAAASGGSVLPASRLPSPEWYAPEMAWALGCSTPGFFTGLGGRLHLPSTSNMLVRRDVLLDNPFQEVEAGDAGGGAWGYGAGREDATLWRDLRRRGMRCVTAPDAIVWHHIPARRMDRAAIRDRARNDGASFWRREHIHEELRPAARDIVFGPIGALAQTWNEGIPLSRSWESHRLWAARQATLLGSAIDDRHHGIPPSRRLGYYLAETAHLAGAVGKAAVRQTALLAWAAAGDSRPVPTVSAPPGRLLVVLHDLLGDAVLAQPMIHQMAQAFPDTEVTVLCGEVSGPLIEANLPEGWSALRVPEEASGRSPQAAWHLHRLLAPLAPDAVLLAYCHGLHPGPLFLLGGAPVVGWPEDNGLNERLWGEMLAAPVPKSFHKPETVALLDLLAPFGARGRAARPRLRASDHGRSRANELLARADPELADSFLVIHVEPDGRDKFWPLTRFLELADRLHEENEGVVLVGSREGRLATEEWRASRPWCISLPGLLDSDQLAAVLESAKVFVGCDSGPAHVAQAVGTPSVVLFGMTEAGRWGPLPRGTDESDCPFTVLQSCSGDWLREEIRGLPENEGMRLLGVERVLGAIREISGAGG